MALSLFQTTSSSSMMATRGLLPSLSSARLWAMGSSSSLLSTPRGSLFPLSLSSSNRTSPSGTSDLFVRCFAKDEVKLTAAQKAALKQTAQKKAQKLEAKKKAKVKQVAQAQTKRRVYSGPKSVHDLPKPTPLRRDKKTPEIVHEDLPSRIPKDPLVGSSPVYKTIETWLRAGGAEIGKESAILNEVFPDLHPAFPLVIPIVAKFNTFHVYQGNPLSAATTKEKPAITWPAMYDEDIFTLALVDLDSPGRQDPHKRPFLHWLIVNIPANKIDKGETLVQYIPALPSKGTGHHRFVFVLFSQKNGVVDTSKAELPLGVDATNLQLREAYPLSDLIKKFKLAAKSLSFFKAQWDESVTEFYSQQGKEEPIYALEQVRSKENIVIPGRRWL